jgi:putative oxidoreductase
MNKLIQMAHAVIALLNGAGAYASMLCLRLFLAYEWLESGLEKWHGQNWFGEDWVKFPFPVSLLPPDLNWNLAMGAELLFGAALAVGLAARFSAFSLIVIDVVAWYTVHAGHGYNVCDNGWKLPMIFLVALVPLVLSGPGKLSVDYWIAKRFARSAS